MSPFINIGFKILGKSTFRKLKSIFKVLIIVPNSSLLSKNNNPTTTNTGTTIVGSTGKITLYSIATGINNSEDDIPVTLDSEDPIPCCWSYC